MESNPSLSRRPVMDFVRAYLKEHPEASFQEVRSKAEREGYKLYPIVYGRAKSLEGLVPVKSRGPRSRPGNKPAAPTPETNRTTLSSLQDILDSFRKSEEQRKRYRRALDRIRALIAKTLEGKEDAFVD